MRQFFFLWFLLFSGFSFSQTINGTVLEKGTGVPLPFANVFINNTTQGVATDVDGKFRLSGNFSNEIELVASFVGYVTEVKTVSFRGKNEVQIDFQLAFNESNLSEVELKAKRDKSWERELRRFEEAFLALPDDPYKSEIEILNPWVLDFGKVKANKGPNYLQATSQEPLRIKNKALGYDLTYYLQDFRVMRNGTRFFGQVFYEPIKSENPQESEQWINARENNFHSSLRQLNQSILLNRRDSIHFSIYQVLPEKMDRRRTNDFYEEMNKSIVSVTKDSILRRPLGDGSYRVFLPGRMEIHHLDKSWRNDYYTNVYHAISWIEAPEGYYDIDLRGTLINPTQLVLSGYLSRQRVARNLPLDFEPNENFVVEALQAEVISSPSMKLNRLREKAWLTTNKPYFYPGETAWLAGRMLYQEPALADSLSRVVYVDLVNSKAEIIQTSTFTIEQGKISGGLVLDQALTPGDYALRAYTYWSQNFGQKDQFITPIIIMNSGFQPKVESTNSEPLFGEVSIIPEISITDSLSYRVMDLKLDFLDEFQNPIESEFILSLVDGEAIVEVDPLSSLEKAMEWLDEPLPANYNSELINSIEYGISIQGKFFPSNKRQPKINPITVVRGDLEDYGQVMTDSSGNFWATGLYFQDTAKIAIAAMDEKLRPYGSVEIFPRKSPLVSQTFPRNSYTKEQIKDEDKLLDLSGDYILLEEFVKEEVKVRETMAQRNYGYGEPTRQVGQEDLERLPWEQIYGKLSIGGKLFGNYNYGEKVGSPLIILDGKNYPFLTGDQIGELLGVLEPSQLESIKVYSSPSDKAIFGMAGYAGVIMIETKKGFRLEPESDRKFNSEGFQIFPVKGFSSFSEFPKNPPSDQFLKKKPTIYWEPIAQTSDGVYKIEVKVPYGVKLIRVKVEGRTQDGEVVYHSSILDLENPILK
jgi:hypothetical protein